MTSFIICLGLFSMSMGIILGQRNFQDVLCLERYLIFALLSSAFIIPQIPALKLNAHYGALIYLGYVVTLFILISTLFSIQLIKNDSIFLTLICELLGGLLAVCIYPYLLKLCGPIMIFLFLAFIISIYSLIRIRTKINFLISLFSLTIFIFGIMNISYYYDIEPFFNHRGDYYQIHKQNDRLASQWTAQGYFEILQSRDTSNGAIVDFDAGTARTNLIDFDGDVKKARANIGANYSFPFWGPEVFLPYELNLLKNGTKSTFIIGGLGGQEAMAAKIFGFNSIIIADVARQAFDLAAQILGGHYIVNSPEIIFYPLDGRYVTREFIKKKMQFDVLQIYSVHANTINSYSSGLELTPLFTKEALESYVQLLKPDGIMAVTQLSRGRLWQWFCSLPMARRQKYREKTVMVEPVPANEHMITLLFKKNGFSSEEIKLIKTRMDGGYRKVTFSPDTEWPRELINFCDKNHEKDGSFKMQATDFYPFYKNFSSSEALNLQRPDHITDSMELNNWGARYPFSKLFYIFFSLLFIISLLIKKLASASLNKSNCISLRDKLVSFIAGVNFFILQTLSIYTFSHFWGEPDTVFIATLSGFLLGSMISTRIARAHLKYTKYFIGPLATLVLLFIWLVIDADFYFSLYFDNYIFRIGIILLGSSLIASSSSIIFPLILLEPNKDKSHVVEIWWFYAIGTLFSYILFKEVGSHHGYDWLLLMLFVFYWLTQMLFIREQPH
ncbi:MAG: hypothetical protein H6623_05940 [Bdellovibrionaceae bacterium]|nr:hypothetical protein [Pseudobdellovibrionaceae bacterium]